MLHPTPVEMRVIERVAAGKTNIQIGRKLSLSPLTVKSHLARLHTRYDYHNRTGLVAMAYHRRWLNCAGHSAVSK